MSSAEDVAKAQVEAQAARGNLTRTVGELQDRLNPRTLVQEGKDKLQDIRRDATDDIVGATRDYPRGTMAVGATVALLLLRRPLWRLGRRLFGRRKETPAPYIV